MEYRLSLIDKKPTDSCRIPIKNRKNTLPSKETLRPLTSKENHKKIFNLDLAIIKENRRLSSNIIKTRSSLSVNKLNADYKKSRKYYSLISKPKNTSTTIRCSSRQEPRRPLLETYNTLNIQTMPNIQ